MKVLFVLPDQYPPGPATAAYIQRHALGLRANGVAVELLCFEKNSDEPELWRQDSLGIPYRCLRFTGSHARKLMRAPVLSRLLAEEVQKAIRVRGATHVWLYDANWLLYHNVIAVCRREAVPVVANLTEWWRFTSDPFRYNYYAQVLFHRLSLPRLNGLLGIATPFIKLARARGIPAMLVPVPCPPEVDRAPVSAGVCAAEGAGFTFFYTGVLQRRDMPEAMLDAMRRLVREKAGIRLVVSGKNDLYREGRAFAGAVAADPALKECVSFTGYLSDDAFRRQRAAADGYVLLHEDSWESRACFPCRLSEFLCAGKPVIVSGVGDIPLYLRDGKDAVVLPPNNQAEALAVAMLQLSQNPKAAASLGIAGRQRALDVFSAAKLGGRVRQFLAGVAR